MNIFDELNLNIDPYKILGIVSSSNDETIKEAYKLKKSNSSPVEKQSIDCAYSLIKNRPLRQRYALLKNRPLDSLDSIKELGFKPVKSNLSQIIELITKS